MTIKGILELISTDENLSKVEIDNELFSLNQIRQILEFQKSIAKYLDAGDWWKHSKNLTKASRSLPDLANLPNFVLITPPYSFPLHARIGDFLGVTANVASRILGTKAKFCAKCTIITPPQSIENIVSACRSNALAISAIASPAAFSKNMFSKIIEDNEVKDFEQFSAPPAPLEVIIERIKISNPDRNIRISRALDFIEKNSLYDASIHSWPLGTFKQKIELASTCGECGTPYLPSARMLLALISSIWSLSVNENILLEELYKPLSRLTTCTFDLLSALKLDNYYPSAFLKDLDPAHLHIIKIQQCILELPVNPVIISPFNFLLPPTVSDYLLSTLKNRLFPGARIIAAVLPHKPSIQSALIQHPVTSGTIRPQLELGSRTILELNRATIDKQSYNAIAAATPSNYKIYSLESTIPTKSLNTRVVSYLGILPHIAQLYANHPTARALGLPPKFFSHDILDFSCAFCGGASVECTFCKGLTFPPDLYLVKFKGKSLAWLLEQEIVGAMYIIGKIPKASTILKAAVNFELGTVRLNSTLSELNIVEQWLLKILKFLLQTPKKSCIILPDLRWCLNENQWDYFERQILKRLEEKGIVIEVNMKLETRVMEPLPD